MLTATIGILASYFILLLLDLINNSVLMAIKGNHKHNINIVYDEFLIFKMLIRRLSMLILFKVLFTLNRV